MCQQLILIGHNKGTHIIAVGVTALSQQGLCLFNIVGVLLLRIAVTEAALGQQVGIFLSSTVHHGGDQSLTIHSIIDRLTEFGIVIGLLFGVHGDKGKCSLLCGGDSDAVGTFNGGADRRLDLGKINTAGLQADRHGGHIRDDLEGHILDGGGAHVVILIGLQHDLVAFIVADELIGAAADGLLGKGFLTGRLIVILGANMYQRQVVQEGREGRRGVDIDGVLIYHLAVVIACHIAGLCLGSGVQIQTERHILGGQRRAVVEGNAVTQMEGIAAGVIADLPAFSDDTVQLALILEVVANQGVIDLGINAVFNAGCPVGGVQRLVISVDGDGQAGAVAVRGVAVVTAAAGDQAQCHGHG